MSTPIQSKHVALLLGLLWLCPAVAWGGDGSGVVDGQVVLTPDDPASTATIDGPWSEPIHIRIVTLSDAPIQLRGDTDPSVPGRFAVAIHDPDGGIVHLNLYEVSPQVTTVRTRTGSRDFVEWTVNTDLPFTRQAEIDAALAGVGIRQPRSLNSLPSQDAVCYRTGESIVEVPILSDLTREFAVSYGVRIVTDLLEDEKRPPAPNDPDGPVVEGGTPGGDPIPPGAVLDGGGAPEGGTPGGDPIPPNILGVERR